MYHFSSVFTELNIFIVFNCYDRFRSDYDEQYWYSSERTGKASFELDLTLHLLCSWLL